MSAQATQTREDEPEAKTPPAADLGEVVQRFDRSPLLPRAELTPEGYLYAPATRIAAVGRQVYTRLDGREGVELRTHEELSDPESLATLRGKPLVHRHPKDKWVNALNFRGLAVGTISEPRLDGDYLVADVLVCDAATVAAVQAGERELSCGYHARLLPTGGVFRMDGHPLDGTACDRLQTRLRYNHVAIEPRGRANDARADRPVQIRLDASDNQIEDDGPREDPPMPMKKITINGAEHDVDEQVAAYIEGLNSALEQMKTQGMMGTPDGPLQAAAEIAQLKAKLAAAEASTQEATGRADAAVARADAAAQQVAAIEALRNDASALETQRKETADRVALILELKAAGSDQKVEDLVRLDGSQLLTELAKRVAPSLDLAGKDANYIRGVLHGFRERRADAGGQIEAQLHPTLRAAETPRLDASGAGNSNNSDQGESPMVAAIRKQEAALYGRQAS